MWMKLGSIVYRAARTVMTLDVTCVAWLARERLVLPRTDPEFTFRFLSPNDVRALGRHPASDLQPSMAERIAAGRDFCFAALAGEWLASYAWFALGSIEAEHHRGPQPASGVPVSFPDHVAFMYKGFTHADFRGHGLYGAVVGLALVGLEPQGVDAILSTMDWTNTAARRALARIGMEELGYCWRWGWPGWMHTRPPREALRRGACFGDAARVEKRPDPPRRPAGIAETAESWRRII